MTEAELHVLEATLREERKIAADLNRPFVSADLALKLVAEIRHTREALESARATMTQASNALETHDVALRRAAVERIKRELNGVPHTALDELRRLRDDDWLSTVAERIAGSANPYDWQANLDVLRKHRDGKA